jgi:hypothetical protein
MADVTFALEDELVTTDEAPVLLLDPLPPTYLLGSWSGLDLYACLIDGYNVFSLDQLESHLLEAHDLTAIPVT